MNNPNTSIKDSILEYMQSLDRPQSSLFLDEIEPSEFVSYVNKTENLLATYDRLKNVE
jgi:hypothetical protein